MPGKRLGTLKGRVFWWGNYRRGVQGKGPLKKLVIKEELGEVERIREPQKK